MELVEQHVVCFSVLGDIVIYTQLLIVVVSGEIEELTIAEFKVSTACISKS